MIKKKILAADLLLTDVIAPAVVEEIDANGKAHDKIVNQPLWDLLQKYRAQGKLTPTNNKITITRQELEELKRVSPLEHNIVIPGGSSANTLVTLSNILPDAIEATFIGVAGQSHKKGDPSDLIQSSLKDAGIRLLHGNCPAGMEPEPAMSYVIMEKGQRFIATYPGNANQILKSDLITDDLVKEHDVLLVQGSLWRKLHDTHAAPGAHVPEDQLGFADKLLHMRRKHGKELWLTLPTQANFSAKLNGENGKTIEVEHSEKAAFYRSLINSANVIMSNDDELSRVFTNFAEYHIILNILDERGITDEMLKEKGAIKKLLDQGKLTPDEVRHYNFVNKSIYAEEALDRLQAQLKTKPLENIVKSEPGKWPPDFDTKQVAFITMGKKGSVAITDDNRRTSIPAPDVPDNQVKCTLGAGDNTYAGILAAFCQKMRDRIFPYDRVLETGSVVSGVKITQDRMAARADHVREALVDSGMMSQEGRFDNAPVMFGEGVLNSWRNKVARDKSAAMARLN